MFQFTGYALLTTIEFIAEYVPMTARGLPHSEISGSSLVSSSPKLFAACYVLHRLWCQGIHLYALILLFKDRHTHYC